MDLNNSVPLLGEYEENALAVISAEKLQMKHFEDLNWLFVLVFFICKANKVVARVKLMTEVKKHLHKKNK